MIVAWRVAYLMMLGRECPDLPCDVAFDEDEWKTAYTVVNNQPPPKKPPSLKTMVELVASLGGYLGRKCDGEPGPKAIWVGIQRLTDLVAVGVPSPSTAPPAQRWCLALTRIRDRVDGRSCSRFEPRLIRSQRGWPFSIRNGNSPDRIATSLVNLYTNDRPVPDQRLARTRCAL